MAAHWDLVQRNALHEKRRIVAEIEKVLSSAGEAAASPPRPPSRPADAAWADEPSSPAEKRGRASAAAAGSSRSARAAAGGVGRVKIAGERESRGRGRDYGIGDGVSPCFLNLKKLLVA